MGSDNSSEPKIQVELKIPVFGNLKVWEFFFLCFFGPCTFLT